MRNFITGHYPIEIEGTAIVPATGSCSGLPAGAICVTVPPSSLGYIVVDIGVVYRLGQPKEIFALYPNPASTQFTIQQIDPFSDNISAMRIEIYNMFGGIIQTSYIAEGETVDISQLPVGVYTVLIETEGLKTETETLVKMK